MATQEITEKQKLSEYRLNESEEAINEIRDAIASMESSLRVQALACLRIKQALTAATN